MPTFATESNGGVVVAGDGKSAYPFQLAKGTSVNPQQLQSSGFPLIDRPPPASAPGAYNNPAFTYSTLVSAMTDGKGTFVGIDASGVNGHDGGSDVYYITQNADGTWGSPQKMWYGGYIDGTSGPYNSTASITGINALGEVLGTGASLYVAWNNIPQSFLYNIKSNTFTDLTRLPVWADANGWSVDPKPIAIDDQGRILLSVGYGGFSPPLYSEEGHTILLTPEGVSSSPLMVPAPEPGALVLACLSLTALAVRRAFRGRRPDRPGR